MNNYFGGTHISAEDPGPHGDSRITTRNEEVCVVIAQAYIFGWAPDYPRASNFIEPQFRCAAFGNASGLCSESLDARIDDAEQLQASDPAAANRAWTAIEHRLVEDAVWVPLINTVSAYVFSARTENVKVHPQWGVLLSRIWVQ